MGGIEQNKPFMTAAGLLPERLWRAAFSIAEEQPGEGGGAAAAHRAALLRRDSRQNSGARRRRHAGRAGRAAAAGDAVVRAYIRAPDPPGVYHGPIRAPHRPVRRNGGRKGANQHAARLFFLQHPHRAGSLSDWRTGFAPGCTPGGFSDTLIVAPPGAGKTTLLRDMVRSVSGRYRVALADERMEIAACRDGEPQFDVGQCDVMSGGCKGDVIPMLLRTMSPQIIALDEITEERDVQTLIAAAYTGCRFLSTAHACALDELNWRPVYKALMGQGIFRNIIAIDAAGGCRRYRVFTEGERENDQTAGRTADRGVVLGGRFFHEQPA